MDDHRSEMTEDGPLRERVSEDVDRRLDALRERFGPFPVDEETVENDPDLFERGRERAAAGWRGDAGAFVTDADGRLLLVRHADTPEQWGVPGGAHKPGESSSRPSGGRSVRRRASTVR